MLALLLSMTLALGAAAEPRPAPSPAPTIELYTMGVGDEAVEKFGHAALCVRWPEGRRGLCYNYGATDFTRPIALGWGFLRGESVFWVATQRPELMLRLYEARDRSVWRQVLPLSGEQARTLAAALARDALPENREYQYHHFYDNCSTRVRDLIDEATGGALSRGADAPLGASYRDAARRGFADMPLLLWASDLVLGRRGDRRPTLYGAMFLPEVLRAEVATRLGAEPELVYERRGPPYPESAPWARPLLMGIALLLAAPAWLTWALGRRERLGLALSLVPVVLLGAIVWLVAIVSPLAEARENQVLAVLFPGDLALLWLSARWRRGYARVRIALIAALSLASAIGLLAQPLWAVAPLALLPLVPAALGRRRDRGASRTTAASEAERPAPGVAD